ncbi:MAG TPA: YihY/virulence factor BrkB family protein [Cyclobacteriaceae bacterium]|nr:YihY/virulence factor BrkB family protein [Cyclobacteriaceae bacterium]
MKNFLVKYISLFKSAAKAWWTRDPFRNSAVIAYYAIFSFPGLLIVIINFVGYFYGPEDVSNRIIFQIQDIIGPQAAKDIQKVIFSASAINKSNLAYAIGLATIMFGATGVFYQLQQTLNLIWEVEPKPKSKLLKLIKDRLFSFGLVLAIGFLLIVSLIFSAFISSISEWVKGHFSNALDLIFNGLDFILSLALITLLFATMFKFLPDTKIPWRTVWGGSVITSFLFVIAKFFLGKYFAYSDPASIYGAAGSLVLIMLWVTYSGIIFLFGAEFTKVTTLNARRKITSHNRAIPAHNTPST